MARRLSNPLELLELATSKLSMRDDSSDDEHLHSSANTLAGRPTVARSPLSNPREVKRRSSFSLLNFRNNELDESQLSEDQNNFPTRSKDLRHVDQSINLMDAEKANYKAPRSDYIFALQESSGDESSDDEEPNNKTPGRRRGSFAMIQSGLSALRRGAVPRRGSLSAVDLMMLDYSEENSVELAAHPKPPRRASKHHSMSFLTDLEDLSARRKSLRASEPPLELSESESSSSDNSWADHLIAIRNAKFWRSFFWVVCLTTLVGTFALTIFTWYHPVAGPAVRRSNENAMPAMETPFPVPSTDEDPATSLSTEPGSIARRRLVLEHVMETSLLPQVHDIDLDPRAPAGRKAVEWMTGYDETSMKLLDAYHYRHHHEDKEPIVLGKHYTIPPAEIDEEREILERYIRVVFYFVAHPNANVKTADIN